MFNSASSVKTPLIGFLAIASLLCAETLLTPLSMLAATPLQAPTRISQLRPWTKAYDCGMSLITLSQQGNSDRYTYEALNGRGQSITVRNGTGTSRGSAAVYSFNSTNGGKFVVEDFRNGKATLTTSGAGVDAATFDCTVATNNGGSSGASPTPARWSHTYQCGEYSVTLREEARNQYSYRTKGIYLQNGEKSNTGRSWVYSFYNSDYAYRLEDAWGGGAANLTVTRYGGTILSRGCRK